MANAAPPPRTTLAPWVDDLQARGRYWFTRDEALAATGLAAPALQAALRRLRQKLRVASPRQGFHVIVPLEHREAGAPPASWWIDALMQAVGQPYHVGLLSAAALHGAAHQQPQEFQVVTDGPTRPLQAGRVRVAFHMSRRLVATPVVSVQTETGAMRVSSPEATALELVRFASASGGLGHVATVLQELAEDLDPDLLADAARAFAPPDVQRLGYLLAALGHDALADAVASALTGRRRRPVLLVTGQGSGGAKHEPRFLVIPNEPLEPDI